MRADFDGARPAGDGVVSWCGVKRRVRDTPPPFRSGDRRMSGSCQHGSRGQSKLPSAASAQESSRDLDADAADPRHAPVSDGGRLLLHPASEQVEGEELEQERRLVGVEGFGGDSSAKRSTLLGATRTLLRRRSVFESVDLTVDVIMNLRQKPRPWFPAKRVTLQRSPEKEGIFQGWTYM